MKKHIPIYLYGAISIFEGVILFIAKQIDFQTMRMIVGITITLGALFAFVAAFRRIRKNVQFIYHEMHAIAMLTYGISVLMLAVSMDKFVSFTAFLLFFYAFSEIIFCNWLFNLGEGVSYRILTFRLFLGIATGVGTVVAMYFPTFTVEIFGALFMLIGVNIMLYAPIMRGHQTMTPISTINP